LITGNATRLRVEANITNPSVGHFMPYYHWFYQGTYHANTTVTLSGPEATFDDWIKLAGHLMTYDPQSRMITVKLQWIGGVPIPYRPSALVDAKIFVHLYDVKDKDGKIVVQADQRPGEGTLPPANWLPGIRQDTITLTIPADTPPGTYSVAIGLY